MVTQELARQAYKRRVYPLLEQGEKLCPDLGDRPRPYANVASSANVSRPSLPLG